MHKPRICLIVDHPARDLDGMVLLAAELGRRGADVYLVPMYQRNEVFLLAPDVVVANYARYANASFLAGCRRLGMRVVVLDTEGGIVQDTGAFAERVRPFLGNVDAYCVWGEEQARAMSAVTHGTGTELVVTGCPRYDFAASQWAGALPSVDVPAGPMVLVNTNFPLLKPRFQSVEQEIHDLVHRIGYDEQWIREFFQQALHARVEVIAATRALAERFEDVHFVIRPHPFESAGEYEAAQRDNLRVRQSGSVFPWIQRASALLHFNCSTAVEAVLMGREPILLDWIDAPLLSQPTSAAISHRPQTLDAAATLLTRILAGSLSLESELTRQRAQIIRDYFNAADGRACQRSADVLMAQAERGRVRRSPGYVLRLAGALPPRNTVQVLLGASMGSRNYDRIKSWAGKGQGAHAKHFDETAVREILGRIRRVDAAVADLHAHNVTAGETAVPAMPPLRTVKVSHAA